MHELIARSTRLVVMAERGRLMLQDIYQAPPTKIDSHPARHPGHTVRRPELLQDQFGVEGRTVLLTFGLLSPTRNRACPACPAAHPCEFPEVVYIVVGATHPNELREQGETYRLGLERLAEKERGSTGMSSSTIGSSRSRS